MGNLPQPKYYGVGIIRLQKMNKEKVIIRTKALANQISQKYQVIENYFTNGSFGVKFYPLLMYPCVRYTQTTIVKLLAVLSVFIGLYFFFSEFIAILFTNEGLSVYLTHSLFELAQPIGTVFDNYTVISSPLSFAVRASFLVQGYCFAFIYFLAVMRITHKLKLLAGISALCFSFGAMLIYSAQGGHYTLGGVQNLGVDITFLVGNLVMLWTAFGLKSEHYPTFKWFCILGGLIGVVAISITLFMPTPYLALLQRISWYSLLIWEIVVGFAILKQVK